jgi:hypothetical protein
MVHFPLKVNSPNENVRIRDRDEFVHKYEQIINGRVRAKILDEKSSRCLFANSKGFMVGDGEVWFAETIPGVFKIIIINSNAN